jgi:hypothetical protein
LFPEVLSGKFFDIRFFEANLSIYAGKFLGYDNGAISAAP